MICLELFFVYVKIAFCSFGGSTTIPLLADEMAVRGWMDVSEISDIVAIAEMTPGSFGINCATFVGIRIAGLAGAFWATLGVMVPSLTLCMVAAHFLFKFKENRYLQNALYGIRPVCIAMILAVVWPMGQTNYTSGGTLCWQAVLIGLLALFLLLKKKLSIPLVILLSAVLGLVLVR